jgi:PLP dependent protein
MSMGEIGNVEEFRLVHQLKHKVIQEFGLPDDDFILSMGTSQDYELAIEEGSNEVRLGTTIFGARNYANKKV